MLLNYLFANFCEESDFLKETGLSLADLRKLTNDRTMPSASYVLESNSRSVSFVSDARDDWTYRYHLRGHLDWVKAIGRLDLRTEQRARAYFENRYAIAKELFLSGSLGSDLTTLEPEVPARFDKAHAEATWNHFSNGVYGVCTRDGQPETIFLKQACVMFIENMTQATTRQLDTVELGVLKKTVALLDSVESEFAPHEVSQASRQRCIADVKARFWNNETA